MRDDGGEEALSVTEAAVKKEYQVEVRDLDAELTIGEQMESAEVQEQPVEVEEEDDQERQDELEQTPTMVDEVGKASGEVGSAEERGGLPSCTDRPRRRTRNMKNSRYDRADYLVDYSGSGQHNKYKLRKIAAEVKEEAMLSNSLALTMNAGSTSEQTKQMPTESCKKQLNRRQQKQTRKERERNNLTGNAARSPSNESQELLN